MEVFDYIERGEVGRVREVVEADPTVLALRGGKDTSPPLVWAARHGRVEVMEVLLELGAGLEEREEDEYTALIVAAWSSQPGAVVHLLRAGADPRARGGSNSNCTALHFAAWRGLAECVGPLVEAGGELDAQNTWGETPLHSASEEGLVEAVRELLAHGADPSLVSSSSMV